MSKFKIFIFIFFIFCNMANGQAQKMDKYLPFILLGEMASTWWQGDKADYRKDLDHPKDDCHNFERDEKNGPPTSFDEYSKIYPYFAEICFSGGESKKGLTYWPSDLKKSLIGKTLVHGFSYIHGLCREDSDKSKDTPQVKRCGKDEFANGAKGVGVTTNLFSTNANFNFVPGRNILLPVLPKKTKYTKKLRDQLAQNIVNTGFYDNIILKKDARPVYRSGVNKGKPMRMNDPQTKKILAKQASGWDFNITLERPVYCARVPLEGEELDIIKDYLNGLNKKIAAKGGLDFSFTRNNCSHPHVNLLAKVGLLKHICTNICAKECKKKPNEEGDMSVPSAAPLDIIRTLNDTNLDAKSLYNNPRTKKLIEDGKLPIRPGTLIFFEGVHSNNDLYEVQDKFMFGPHYHSKTFSKTLGNHFYFQTNQPYQYYLKKSRYNNVAANLQHHKRKLSMALEALEKKMATGERRNRRNSKYYKWLLKYKAALIKELAKIDSF